MITFSFSQHSYVPSTTFLFSSAGQSAEISQQLDDSVAEFISFQKESFTFTDTDYHPGINFFFGDPVIDVFGSFSEYLDDCTAVFVSTTNSIVYGSFVAELEDCSSLIRGHLQISNAPVVSGQNCTSLDSAIPVSTATCFQQNAISPVQTGACFSFNKAIFYSNKTLVNLFASLQLHQKRQFVFSDAEFMGLKTCTQLTKLDLINKLSCFDNDDGLALQRKTRTAIRLLNSYYTKTKIAQVDADAARSQPFCFNHKQLALKRPKRCTTLEDGIYPLPGESPFIDPPVAPVDDQPTTITTIIPVKDVYHMQNSFSVTLLDLTPVDFSSINIGWDRDSFAWSFTGSDLNESHINLVQQVGLTPVQLVVNINAVTINIIVDQISRKRVFGNSSITVTGSGISNLLNYPHYQRASVTHDVLSTNQQIADSLMPIGWTINWNVPTWLITAGAYSHYNKSPVQAVSDIAKSIGAVLIPHMQNQVLNIEPAYPAYPWNYATSTPDYIIPDSVIIEATEVSIVDSQINGVYVHGSEIGGELGFCRLTGTAGDVLATTVEAALMTDVVGLRLLGERILASEATQPKLKDIMIPLSNDVPFIPPNSFVKIQYNGEDIFGVVNSINIDASFTEQLCDVFQRITIGERTTNTLARFKRMTANEPLLIATLSSTNGNTSVMTLIDGGVLNVRGTGSIGGNYYIRSGMIEGQAPNLPLNNIVI